MEPENDKPGANEAESDAKRVEGKAASKGGEARVVAGGGPRMAPRGMNERRFAKVSRRELLKVVPVLALGAFAIPSFQESLLKKGLGFSDWASERLFRRGHLAPTFADAEVTPFEKFPINGYDVDDPGVDFANWSLTVSGAVKKPGDYRLVADSGVAAVPAEYAACVRGRVGCDRTVWRRAAVGFSDNDWGGHFGAISDLGLCGRLLRIAGHGDGAASADAALL